MPGAGTTPALATPQVAWQVRTFSAAPAQVAQARHFLASLLGTSALRDDAVLCLSEVATNAVRHSASRHPGGTFEVRATVVGGGLRVEVSDAGGPWPGEPEPGVEPGHGLAIVAALASRWGIDGDDGARTVWFEIAT